MAKTDPAAPAPARTTKYEVERKAEVPRNGSSASMTPAPPVSWVPVATVEVERREQALAAALGSDLSKVTAGKYRVIASSAIGEEVSVRPRQEWTLDIGVAAEALAPAPGGEGASK